MRLDPAFSATAPKVLVIDDDKGLCEIIRLTLVPKCVVRTAASVDEGLELFRAVKPDTVIMDYQMPGKNGIQGLQEIRQMDPKVPVILLTAFADMDMARKAIKLGATEYMTKPFNVTDLRAVVDRCTAMARAQRQGTSPAQMSETPRFSIDLDDAESIDIPPLEKLSPGDGEPGGAEPKGGARPGTNSESKPRFPSSGTPPKAVSRLFLKENFIECKTSKGVPFRANVLRLNPTNIVCEIFDPSLDIRVADVLTDCKVVLGKPVFSVGKVVVTELVNTGILLICELGFKTKWHERAASKPPQATAQAGTASPEVAPEEESSSSETAGSSADSPFQKVVADLDGLLEELKSTLEKFEQRLRPSDKRFRERAEEAIIQTLSRNVLPAINRLTGRFEEAASAAPPEQEKRYRNYVRNRLHAHFEAADILLARASNSDEIPQAARQEYARPDRILEEPAAGAPLFSRALHTWLTTTPAGDALRYRNRFLAETLRAATEWCREEGRNTRIFELTAGPVPEIEQFVANEGVADHAEITIASLGKESLRKIESTLDAVCRDRQRSTRIELVHLPINRFLSDGNRLLNTEAPPGDAGSLLVEQHFDLILCAGVLPLFSDRVCRRFMEIFYRMVKPGGFIVVCNFAPGNPLRYFMEYLMDEEIRHRTRQEMLALVPVSLAPDYFRLTQIPNGVETFLHLLKPESRIAASSQLELFE